MKVLNLCKWSICIDNGNETVNTIQENNKLAVFFEDNQFMILLTVNERENIVMERCSAPCRCEIDHEQKKVLIEVV